MRGAALRDVVEAELALVRAQLRVWTRPTGRLVRSVEPSRACDGMPAAPDAERIAAAARAATLALERALRHGPFRPGCLVRSLALADLLARRGVPQGLIRLGVRRGAGRLLDAHAWVELDGRVIGDDPRHVRRFTPLGAVAPAARR